MVGSGRPRPEPRENPKFTSLILRVLCRILAMVVLLWFRGVEARVPSSALSHLQPLLSRCEMLAIEEFGDHRGFKDLLPPSIVEERRRGRRVGVDAEEQNGWRSGPSQSGPIRFYSSFSAASQDIRSPISLLYNHLVTFKMGWLWGNSSQDPVKDLDPNLRKYLEQESSDKHVPAHDVKQPSAPVSTTPELQDPEDPSTLKVPSASLYQDGRYAHLWKTYKPPVDAADESSGVRGAERVIEKYKQRGDTVQRAAMENCAIEHEALTLCFQTGNWRKQIESRLTMCAAENGTFSRCFETQSVSL